MSVKQYIHNLEFSGCTFGNHWVYSIDVPLLWWDPTPVSLFCDPTTSHGGSSILPRDVSTLSRELLPVPNPPSWPCNPPGTTDQTVGPSFRELVSTGGDGPETLTTTSLVDRFLSSFREATGGLNVEGEAPHRNFNFLSSNYWTRYQILCYR